MNHPVEKTVRYAQGGLPDLQAAWAFVMAHVDLVGPDPQIKITPVWSAQGDGLPRQFDEAPWVRTFSAVVDGMVEEEGPA